MDRTLTSFERRIAVDPTNLELRVAYANRLRDRDNGEAIDQLRYALGIDSTHLEARSLHRELDPLGLSWTAMVDRSNPTSLVVYEPGRESVTLSAEKLQVGRFMQIFYEDGRFRWRGFIGSTMPHQFVDVPTGSEIQRNKAEAFDPIPSHRNPPTGFQDLQELCGGDDPPGHVLLVSLNRLIYLGMDGDTPTAIRGSRLFRPLENTYLGETTAILQNQMVYSLHTDGFRSETGEEVDQFLFADKFPIPAVRTENRVSQEADLMIGWVRGFSDTVEVPRAIADILYELAGKDTLRQYSHRENFIIGEHLNHTKFGKGKVLKIQGRNIKVQFEKGIKTLRHYP